MGMLLMLLNNIQKKTVDKAMVVFKTKAISFNNRSAAKKIKLNCNLYWLL
jgi:hypothetical protein